MQFVVANCGAIQVGRQRNRRARLGVLACPRAAADVLLLALGSRLSAGVCCAGLQRNSAHTLKLLDGLPGVGQSSPPSPRTSQALEVVRQRKDARAERRGALSSRLPRVAERSHQGPRTPAVTIRTTLAGIILFCSCGPALSRNLVLSLSPSLSPPPPPLSSRHHTDPRCMARGFHHLPHLFSPPTPSFHSRVSCAAAAAVSCESLSATATAAATAAAAAASPPPVWRVLAEVDTTLLASTLVWRDRGESLAELK